MVWLSPQRRLPVTIALVVLLIVIGTILGRTHGPAPKAGQTYTGTVVVETKAGKITANLPISFRVTDSGKAIQNFTFGDGVPRSCHAATGSAVSTPTPIVNPSRFTTTLAIRRAAARVGTLTISGEFHTFGRMGGAIATAFTAPGLRGCAAAGGYNAKAES